METKHWMMAKSRVNFCTKFIFQSLWTQKKIENWRLTAKAPKQKKMPGKLLNFRGKKLRFWLFDFSHFSVVILRPSNLGRVTGGYIRNQFFENAFEAFPQESMGLPVCQEMGVFVSKTIYLELDTDWGEVELAKKYKNLQPKFHRISLGS